MTPNTARAERTASSFSVNGVTRILRSIKSSLATLDDYDAALGDRGREAREESRLLLKQKEADAELALAIRLASHPHEADEAV
jgi:hypothetical protein